MPEILKPYRTTPPAATLPWEMVSTVESPALLLSDSPERLVASHLPSAVLSRMRGVLDGEGRAQVRVFLWHLNQTGKPVDVGVRIGGAQIQVHRAASLIHPNYYKVGMTLAAAHLFAEYEPAPTEVSVPNRRLLGAVHALTLAGESGAPFAVQSYACLPGMAPGFDAPCAELEVHPRGAWPCCSLRAQRAEAVDVSKGAEFALCERGELDLTMFTAEASTLHDGPSHTNRGLWGVDAEYAVRLINPTDRTIQTTAEVVARNTGGVFHGAIEALPSGARGIVPPIQHGKDNAVRLPLADVLPGEEIEAVVRFAMGGAATLPVNLRIAPA